MVVESGQVRAYQAHEREDDMALRFGMQGTREGRGGLDAVLRLPHADDVSFELKSTDGTSFSTARDVGREHLRKWRQHHWLFGVYRRGLTPRDGAHEFLYAPPWLLEPWIAKQEEYVNLDWDLVRRVPSMIDAKTMAELVGARDSYTAEEVGKLLKKQKLETVETDDESAPHMTGELLQLLKASGGAIPKKISKRLIEDLADLQLPAVPPAKKSVPAFSPERMLILVRERCRYLLDRGSTRNNPHITLKELRDLVGDDNVFAAESELDGRDWLRERVRSEALLQDSKASAIDPATT